MPTKQHTRKPSGSVHSRTKRATTENPAATRGAQSTPNLNAAALDLLELAQRVSMDADLKLRDLARRALAKAKVPAAVPPSSGPEGRPSAEERERRLAEYARQNERTIELGAQLVVSNLSDDERAYLAKCQILYHGDRGCGTPFEAFFTQLVAMVNTGKWPTPDDVRRELKSFEENFDDMLLQAERFMVNYPTTHPRRAERRDAAAAAGGRSNG
jgi:hypothetical protein